MTYIITMTKSAYEPTASGKGFKSKPFKTETSVITEENYKNITDEDTLKFFRRLGGSETAERAYTPNGFNIVKITSTSPTRHEKNVRTFSIKVAK